MPDEHSLQLCITRFSNVVVNNFVTTAHRSKRIV